MGWIYQGMNAQNGFISKIFAQSQKHSAKAAYRIVNNHVLSINNGLILILFQALIQTDIAIMFRQTLGKIMPAFAIRYKIIIFGVIRI